MSGLFDELLAIGAFVKGGIIHNDGGSLGSKYCESHAKNTSELTEPVNRVAVSREDANKAPMIWVRPFVHQSCLPP